MSVVYLGWDEYNWKRRGKGPASGKFYLKMDIPKFKFDISDVFKNRYVERKIGFPRNYIKRVQKMQKPKPGFDHYLWPGNYHRLSRARLFF